MTIRRLLSSCALLTGCAGAVFESDPYEADAEAPEIATLVMRDRAMRVMSTPSGVRYDVRAENGIAHDRLTLEQLEAFAPELAELMRSASARQPALDARLDPAPAPTADVTTWAGR